MVQNKLVGASVPLRLESQALQTYRAGAVTEDTGSVWACQALPRVARMPAASVPLQLQGTH